MTVKRLACDPEFSAQVADLGAGLTHRGLRKPQLGRRHFVRAPAVTAAGPCRGQTGLCALDDQRVLELGQRGENTEYETTVCCRRVELRALACQNLQADP